MEMWSRSDVLDAVDYRLELCQDHERRRLFRLLRVGGRRSSDIESVAVTERVLDRDLLKRGDILGLAELTKLESGEPYLVDAHGVWFMRKEWDQLMQCLDGRMRLEDISWATSRPPRLPPR